MIFHLSLFTLFFPLLLQAISINLGPLHIGSSGGSDPVCSAITKQQLLEIVVKPDKEDGEPKRLLFKPHLLGFTEERELVLHGVPVEKIESGLELDKEAPKGFLGGLPSIFHEGEPINISAAAILDLREVKGSEFEPLKIESDPKIVEPICGLRF